MFPTIKTGEGGSPLSGGMETLQQFHQQTISESIQFPAFYYGEMQSRKSEMNYLKNEIIIEAGRQIRTCGIDILL